MWTIGIIVDSIFILILLSAKSIYGLYCYECLSLECESRAICESIRMTMERIFGPKRHNIDFDPNDKCPNDNDLNDPEWVSLSRECPRSDSVCLFASLEVFTVFEGIMDKTVLESSSNMTSKGHLRGCANRRKILDSDPTIVVTTKMTSELNQSVITDAYEIAQIHSHTFFVEVNTEKSLRCYSDNCNSKGPTQSNSSNGVTFQITLVNSMIVIILLKNG